jgi:flagellar biosynthetic protein FliQ
VTQINEATLAFLPKLIAIGLAMVMLGPFMMATLTSFTHQLLDRIVQIGGS